MPASIAMIAMTSSSSIRVKARIPAFAIAVGLRAEPGVLRLNPNGRVAILTFHSGEDRRVKKAFASSLRDGLYAEIAHDVIRAKGKEFPCH